MTAQQQYEMLRKELNEQQWRWYLGTEALKIGSGGISQVANLSGADWKTVQRGVKELKGERARAQISHQEDGSGRLAPRARLFARVNVYDYRSLAAGKAIRDARL